MAFEARRVPLPSDVPRWARELVDYVFEFARDWTQYPIREGAVISVTFSAGTVEVAHKLRRRPRGFVVLQPQDSTYPYATVANWAARTDSFVTLTAGAAFTSDVWFF